MEKKYFVLASVLIAAVLVSGCVEKPASEEGAANVSAPETFRLLVSDQPAAIGDFDSVEVTFEKARIFGTDAPENETAWYEESIGDDAVDLTKLTGKLSYPLIELALEAGEYSKIELYIGEIEAILGNGTVEVEVPSDKLMITKPFTVSENDTTSFVFDINVVKKGATGEYNLRPVIDESGEVGEDIDEEDVEECDEKGEDCEKHEEVRERIREKWEEAREAKEEANEAIGEVEELLKELGGEGINASSKGLARAKEALDAGNYSQAEKLAEQAEEDLEKAEEAAEEAKEKAEEAAEEAKEKAEEAAEEAKEKAEEAAEEAKEKAEEKKEEHKGDEEAEEAKEDGEEKGEEESAEAKGGGKGENGDESDSEDSEDTDSEESDDDSKE